MTPFRATPAGYVAQWEPVEREVLARVARDVAGLLRTDSGLPEDAVGQDVAFTGVPRVPRDPAVQRLLPDAHREDADVAAEFRHLTQTDLAAGKVARLEVFADTLDGGDGLEEFLGLAGNGDSDAGGAADGDGQVVVAREAAHDFAGALTDMRLVLGERLALDDDADVEMLHHEVLTGLGIVDDDEDDAGAADDRSGSASDADDGTEMGPGQRAYWGGVFVAAGFAQESLMDEMLAELRAGRAGDPGDPGLATLATRAARVSDAVVPAALELSEPPRR